jgi:nucleoside-diphosphate-sugar epimerase
VDILISGDKISAEKAKTRLGYAPRPITESLSDAVKWYMEQSAAGQ